MPSFNRGGLILLTIMNRKKLIESLKIVSLGVAQGNAMPVLSCVGINIWDGVVHLFTNNGLGTEVHTKFTAQKAKGMAAAVDFNKLFSLVYKIDADEIDLSLDDDNIVIKKKGGKYKIPAFDIDEMPISPTIEEGVEVSGSIDASSDLFKVAISFVAKKDHPSQAITCISFDGGAVTSVDGYALSSSTMDIGSIECLLSQETCAMLTKIGGVFDVRMSGDLIEFSSRNTVIFSRSLELTFPQWRAVIPQGIEKYWTVEPSLIVSKIETLLAVSDKEYHKMIMILKSNGSIKFIAGDLDFNLSGIEEFTDKSVDFDVKVAVDASKLLKFLSSIPSDIVKIGFHDDKSQRLKFESRGHVGMLVGLAEDLSKYE